jgi:hypothetical protein
MPQIMQVQPGQANVIPRLSPDDIEIRPAKQASLRTQKDQAVCPGLTKAVHMPAQLRHDLTGKGHHPVTGP